MKTKLVVFITSFLFVLNLVQGQEKRLKFILFETGMDFISCEPPEKDYIRGEVDPYAYDYETSTLRGLLYKNYLGAKIEVRMLNNKLGLLGGIRFTHMISSIGKETYWSDTPNFFYLQFRQEGTTTEYLKIKELNQKSGYLGIPLELRIYPYKPRTFTVYYKIGTDLNLRVRTKTDVVFFNKAMEPFQDEVGKIIDAPWSFYSSCHLGVGFKLGKDPKPGVNFEICVPAAVLANGKTSLVTPQVGGGFQFNVRIPL